MKSMTLLLFSIIFTTVGLAVGFVTGRPTPKAAKPDEAGAHEPPKPKISPQTLNNLGVTTKEAETQTFIKTRPIAAVVEELPTSDVPLFAPAGGTIVEIAVYPKTILAAGSLVMKIVRDPLPRPTLTLTEEIIKPATEQFHGFVGEIRKAYRGTELLRTELERVKKFTETGTQDDLPILPRKNAIDLRYDLARAEQDLENARENLRLHGVADEQLHELEAGKNIIVGTPKIWQRALSRNGLWTEQSQALHDALAGNESPWTVASIGELTGAGLVTQELVAWIKSDPAAAKRFVDIAALMQQGNSLERLKTLHAKNGLEPVIEVKTPAGAPDWDVEELFVRQGERVEAGTKLALLGDHRQMQLRIEPIGAEVSTLLRVLSSHDEMEAAPLVDASGPKLKGLKLMSITQSDDTHQAVAIAEVPNEAAGIVEGPRGKFRTWKLREGQAYSLKVPTDKMDNVFVVPSDAVTDSGADKVIFIRDGDSFKEVKIELLYQDQESAVIANNKETELFPGDEVVQHGAFGLGLALKAAGEGEHEGEGEGGHHHHHH
jgi:multidrug efflux pump subunit AcrA (membrane-fusion protein)